MCIPDQPQGRGVLHATQRSPVDGQNPRSEGRPDDLRPDLRHGGYGRNILGTPSQGRADYAFFGHILASLKPKTGRCAILFPHGVLFRDEEHIQRILKTYQKFEDVDGFARVVPLDEIRSNTSSLSIPLYVRSKANGVASGTNDKPLAKVVEEWQASSRTLRSSMKHLLAQLDGP